MEDLYQQLPYPDSIRVLEFPVRHASIDELPDFSLVTIRLSGPDAPPYQALSYTWGEDTEQHTIAVNGVHIHIRLNLWQFLDRALSSDDLDISYLFVDAICISQTDLKEKAAQVQQMDHIFKSASRVLVWLGVDEGKPSALGTLGSGHVPSKALLDRALRVPYWTRTWIIQEFILARKLLVCYGEHLLTCKRLEKHWKDTMPTDAAMMYWANNMKHAQIRSRGEALYTCSKILMLRNDENSESEPGQISHDLGDNLELFQAFGRSHCSLILDKVYALSGLINWQGLTRLQVDYTIDEVELYLRVLSCMDTIVSFLKAKHLADALQLSPSDLIKRSRKLCESRLLSGLNIVAEMVLSTGTVGHTWDLSKLPMIQLRRHKHSGSNGLYLHSGSIKEENELIRLKDSTIGKTTRGPAELVLRRIELSTQYRVQGIVFQYWYGLPHQFPKPCTDGCGGLLSGLVWDLKDRFEGNFKVPMNAQTWLSLCRHQWIWDGTLNDDETMNT